MLCLALSLLCSCSEAGRGNVNPQVAAWAKRENSSLEGPVAVRLPRSMTDQQKQDVNGFCKRYDHYFGKAAEVLNSPTDNADHIWFDILSGKFNPESESPSWFKLNEPVGISILEGKSVDAYFVQWKSYANSFAGYDIWVVIYATPEQPLGAAIYGLPSGSVEKMKKLNVYVPKDSFSKFPGNVTNLEDIHVPTKR